MFDIPCCLNHEVNLKIVENIQDDSGEKDIILWGWYYRIVRKNSYEQVSNFEWLPRNGYLDLWYDMIWYIY